MKNIIVPGQCWVSHTEPELGLGFIQSVDARSVSIHFRAQNIVRTYSSSATSLHRVEFRVGDKVTAEDGRCILVSLVKQMDGLIAYLGAGECIIESELSSQINFSKPEDRLLAGQSDDVFSFKLRQKALQLSYKIQNSNVQGFMGPRVSLLPHQFYVADQIAKRPFPRALLADEVGLGKTIEAGLIIHRLLTTGQALRVLIIVPESLCHQWFVEMYRKFNLSFTILNQETEMICEKNPFDEGPLYISSMDLLSSHEKMGQYALDSSWDMVIVDEAHRMVWSQTEESPQYSLVKKLSVMCKGLILLTATPEQLGLEGHFSRLALLDPDRFSSFATFVNETKNYKELAHLADQILEFDQLNAKEKNKVNKNLQTWFPEKKEMDLSQASTRFAFIEEMIDQHGIGRILYRNSRQTLGETGMVFTQRVPFAYPLDEGKDGQASKLAWLLDFLTAKKEQKILLICEKFKHLQEIYAFLKKHSAIKCAVFHENLSLLERDRNAAYFSEDDGAQVLISTEIGSEGRNFQFASDLVLFDLPMSPDVLEQRIGRLDRIGQNNDVSIHIPYIKDSAAEVLYRCYEQGLKAFSDRLVGAQQVWDECLGDIQKYIELGLNQNFTQLIQTIDKKYKANLEVIQKGRDRLLELHSFRPMLADKVIEKIKVEEASDFLENFMLATFELLGIEEEDMRKGVYYIKSGPGMKHTSFPILTDEGMPITFDREIALKQQDVHFMSSEHPLLRAMLDHILGENLGSACISRWKEGSKKDIPVIEAFYVLDVKAEASLNVNQFFPPKLFRVAMNSSGKNVSVLWPVEEVKKNIENVKAAQKNQIMSIGRSQIKQMLGVCESALEQEKERVLEELNAEMQKHMNYEIDRLEELQKKNALVKDEEIEFFKMKKERLLSASQKAELRLDSFQLILP